MHRKTRQKKRCLEVDREAVRILRTVKDEEAFYFYAAVGQPTGEKAASLLDFLEKIKTVKMESLTFHLQRKDFQKWLQRTIGDSELAKKVESIHASDNEKTRIKMLVTIDNHVKELRKGAPIALSVSENFVMASAS